MDYSYLSERVKALQQELAQIAEHNRQYFAKRKHTPQDRAHHQELRERVYKIRADLYGLIEKSTQRAG
jgi:succinate dehydrogenase/fumarate reductase flavoprotein subunit